MKENKYDLKPYWWQRLIPRYGNWGGVGWSGGRWCNNKELTNWRVPPIDEMDVLFREHDFAYQTKQDTRLADWYLVKKLCQLNMPRTRENIYRYSAIVLFTIVYFFKSIVAIYLRLTRRS